jgi:hypothetical protein
VLGRRRSGGARALVLQEEPKTSVVGGARAALGRSAKPAKPAKRAPAGNNNSQIASRGRRGFAAAGNFIGAAIRNSGGSPPAGSGVLGHSGGTRAIECTSSRKRGKGRARHYSGTSLFLRRPSSTLDRVGARVEPSRDWQIALLGRRSARVPAPRADRAKGFNNSRSADHGWRAERKYPPVNIRRTAIPLTAACPVRWSGSAPSYPTGRAEVSL